MSPELKAREAEILATDDRIKELEYAIFVQVRDQVAAQAARLRKVARLLATLDVLSTLAEVAARRGYTRPKVDTSKRILIRQGRHPVVEHLLPPGERFVPNDVELDGEERRLIIVTGPNMAGKSVFIRQVALIALMAQMGSFVPAEEAHIGLVDRIFARVGASDDIAHGRSTFLVEMSETAHILRHATERSLVILDEVGRGTSTYDGISIAWAVAEDLHDAIGARTLFATHYHELTALADHLPAAYNVTLAVVERGHEVIFLRQVVPGTAEKSFGIHVARLAGLPERVVRRATEVLRSLESRQAGQQEAAPPVTSREANSSAENRSAEETATPQPRRVAEVASPYFTGEDATVAQVIRVIQELDIANTTPLQALVLLHELQAQLRGSAAAIPLNGGDPSAQKARPQ